MKVDVELMFECLMYLNAHYYPVFAISEASMTIAKHISEKKHTPNLDRDAMVCSLRLFIELAKLILFKRYKDDHRSKNSNGRSSFYDDDNSGYSLLHSIRSGSYAETGKRLLVPDDHVDDSGTSFWNMVHHSM
ncbi:uncharacterized protein isoform X2 [Leptinotarsa decemlineata]|uniref:uncharacterized protein isoform X2 n=1 Tax=Leptinotarsa decemlineata TaxID=7539 RepID=UPI000C252398|nr:uncharacterized protein LOC111508101 isoform X2 [Leptinotarsa decemlineata]